jgi:hypothetical protein
MSDAAKGRFDRTFYAIKLLNIVSDNFLLLCIFMTTKKAKTHQYV